MNSVCDSTICMACMACVNACPHDAINVIDKMKSYEAQIDTNKCVNCGICKNVCPALNEIECHSPKMWYQGWALSEKIRSNSSSGGLATAIATSFIENGGCVCSCKFEKGEFVFDIVDDLKKLNNFVGSKYVKSNPKLIYREIKKLLKENRDVLMIALPCQIAALKNYLPTALKDKLYTIDLICHGTPSQKNLNKFLEQYNLSLNVIQNIKFRVKENFRLAYGEKTFAPKYSLDSYTLAFLNSANYVESCYNCKFAKLDRDSDLTIGDSWGSNLDNKEKEKGISLVLINTERGDKLLKQSKLYLFDVNIETAIANNSQLNHPSIKPKFYNKFFSLLNDNKYDKAVSKVLPVKYFKQKVKPILRKIKTSKMNNYNGFLGSIGGGGYIPMVVVSESQDENTFYN